MTRKDRCLRLTAAFFLLADSRRIYCLSKPKRERAVITGTGGQI